MMNQDWHEELSKEESESLGGYKTLGDCWQDNMSEQPGEIKSNVVNEYIGNTKVTISWSAGSEIVVLPNQAEALSVAQLAVSVEFGGATRAMIEESADKVTHKTAYCWAE